MTYTFETERLLLRPITLNDVDDFFELDSNPNVHRFLGNQPVKTKDESLKVIKNILGQYDEFGIGRMAIILKDTQEFVGWSGLKFEKIVRKEFDYYDLGYRIKEQYWGQGIASESALASLEYGFKTLNLDKICAAAEAEHAVSNHILSKIGLAFSGTFTFEDTLCYWYEKQNPYQ